MWLTSSSIGRKFIMALTGCFLILFVTFHALMNGVAIFWPTAYNVICEFLGANWYALVGSLVLALGFILHIVYASWLTVQNRKARGNERYNVESRPAQVEWSSKNMYVLGLVVLAFLVVHLIQFWAKMQYAEISGCLATDCSGAVIPPAAGTWFLQLAFSNIWVLVCYVIGFVALWFHMTHGFWSMFQSCGWNGKVWMNRLKCIGNVWTTLVIALFILEAVVFTINARNNYYTTDPALQEQYQEMYAAADENCCVAETTCPKAECDKADCAKAECGKADCAKAECGNAEACGNAAACGNAECANENCDKAACTCPEGTCGQEGVCKENNCAGCPQAAAAQTDNN